MYTSLKCLCFQQNGRARDSGEPGHGALAGSPDSRSYHTQGEGSGAQWLVPGIPVFGRLCLLESSLESKLPGQFKVILSSRRPYLERVRAKTVWQGSSLPNTLIGTSGTYVIFFFFLNQNLPLICADFQSGIQLLFHTFTSNQAHV